MGLEPIRSVWKTDMLPTTSAVQVPPHIAGRVEKKGGMNHMSIFDTYMISQVL